MERIWMDIESILSLVENNHNISDIHLSSGENIAYRLNGDIHREEEAGILTNENVELFLKQLFQWNPQRFNKFLWDKEADFAYISRNNTPYRVNAFFKTWRIAIVLRKIESEPKHLEDMMFKDTAETIKNLVLTKKSGLFIVSGPTWAGKTTSLISILEEINRNRTWNLITIEDPIEYIFQSKQSLVSQREVWNDTWSVKNALKSAMREDPDFIFVWEIRDTETAEAVLNLAETGHLVFTTLHTSSASHTVSRFLSFFGSENKQSVADRLSENLVGVLSQHLVKHQSGKTRVWVYELMPNTTSIKNNIKKLEIDQIDIILQSPSIPGMISAKNYAQNLVDKWLVSREEVSWVLWNKNPNWM